MKEYIASVRDKKTKQLMIIKREYNRKSDFYTDLRKNGYSVRFITTEEKFDEDCQKWHDKNELCKNISRKRTKFNRELRAKSNQNISESIRGAF